MPDFSSVIPETNQNVSHGIMDMLVQSQRQELFTGLMRIRYPAGENLMFTFLDGQQQKLYRLSADHTETIPRLTWHQMLNRSDASVGLLALPVEGLCLMRLAHESLVSLVEEATLSLQELINKFGEWVPDDQPSIVHACADKLDYIYVIPGQSNPVIEELSIASGQAHFSIGDASSFAQSLPKVEYKVTRYVCIREHDSWHEYELRLAMNPLMRMLIARFGELAGRVLAERLCEQVSTWARGGGWNISINSNGMVNRQYFDSLDGAIRVYVGILRRFKDEAGLAIGSRLAENISREILLKLDLNRREILTQYIFGQYGFVDAVMAPQKEGAQL